MIELLFKKYKNDVYAYLISLTHNKTLAEDLTSETFLSAIKSLSKFKGQSSAKTWLFSIARFKWYEHLRKEKIKFTDDDLLVYSLSDIKNIEQEVINSELVKRTYELLDGDKNKDIFIMRILGFSYYEISLKHNISESSARVIEFRTRKKLKEILAKEGYFDE